MKLISSIGLVLITASLLSLRAVSDDRELSAEEKAVVAAELPNYPLKTCVVSNRPLDVGEGPFDLVVEGHLFRLCCPGCEDRARAKAAEIRKTIERAVISKGRAHWPLKRCPVSGEPYEESEGSPVELVHGTRYVKLCCKNCVGAFEFDPAVFMKEIDAAYIAGQLKGYPLKTCPVSGKPLGDEPVDFLYGTTLVRLCCKGCTKTFDKAPDPFVKKIHAAWSKAHAKEGKRETGKE